MVFNSLNVFINMYFFKSDIQVTLQNMKIGIINRFICKYQRLFIEIL